MLCFMAGALCAQEQEKDVTKFLGIPVDGTKAQMIQKLKAKGFTLKHFENTEFLEGEFNGEPVHVFIATDNNKVWRICVQDAKSRDAEQIRLRFNRLAGQFIQNGKYMPYSTINIPEGENMNYQIQIKDSTYSAKFLQHEGNVDTTGLFEWGVKFVEQNNDKIEWDELSEIELTLLLAKEWLLEKISHKFVWFTIATKGRNEYWIAMYYDNLLNRSNGEDL